MRLGRAYAKQDATRRAISSSRSWWKRPSNEEAHRELMTLYALTGRRSDALRQFRRCCDAVRADLGAEPDEATIQLHRQIVAGRLALPHKRGRPVRRRSIDRIAVLPFDNETDDPDLEYLSTGIAESLIRNLSQVQNVRVLAYSTVSRFRGGERNPRTLGRELDVQSGRHRSHRPGARNTDNRDGAGRHLRWFPAVGRAIPCRQTDVLAIQEEISREICEKLKVRMTVEERRLIVKRYTADPEAYRCT